MNISELIESITGSVDDVSDAFDKMQRLHATGLHESDPAEFMLRQMSLQNAALVAHTRSISDMLRYLAAEAGLVAPEQPRLTLVSDPEEPQA